MNIKYIIEKLERYTDIPRLKFEFETNEYIYMADTMDQINYIFKNINLIEGHKRNLKKYKDDQETIRNIKESINYYEDLIEKSLIELEQNYKQHYYKINHREYIEEEKDEQNL